ncbi:MAG: N-acetylmuramoyl-L-alanine amidase [Gemmatimonadota bacterium]
MRRAPADTTAEEHFDFLFRTAYPAAARVGGRPVKVYRTGVFFDSVSLAPGPNRVRAEVLLPDSSRALYEAEYVRVPEARRAAFPLWIEARSVEPRQEAVLLPEDVLRLSFRGSAGQRATFRVRPGQVTVPCQREDGEDYGTYRADLPLRRLQPGRPHRLEIELESADPGHRGERLKQALEATVEVRPLDEMPLLRTVAAEAPLSYSLGRARLGGPFVAEYGPGVVLQSSGRFGNTYRVRLGPAQVGYIQARLVEELPAGTVRPGYFAYSLHAAPADSGAADEVAIPYPEPVAYAVRSDPEQRRILVTLYGVQSTTTWVQHRSGLRYVERLAWEQVDAETYQVAVQLNTDRIWGYEVRVADGWLVLRLPHPPARDAGRGPLAGLRIAIEAGHGGDNRGAVGLSGLLEKDLNLDVALRLGALCRAAGMEVYQLRPDDAGVEYMARRDSAAASGADLVVSIHTNAGGRGYLGAGGTSTYYGDPFWHDFAARVYARLLTLDLGEFGVVGSFNYRNTRLTSRPAILVEQAFATHAGDEERLADPAFRARVAEQILAGIADYVRDLRGAAAGSAAGAQDR